MHRPQLDHVAVAVERHTDVFPRYAGELGGAWVSGGKTIGFAPAQVRYANGMKVEILQPHAVHLNDFLRRFLDRRGPGAHHFTFKVPDIEGALEDVRTHGIEPVGVDLTDPGWKEAFIRPRDACGIVVQLAQAQGEWCNPPPPGFPEPRPERPAELVRAVHSVPSLERGTALFERLLAGERTDEGEGWVDLAWPGAGRIRLIEDPKTEPGLAHLRFAVDDPSAISHARPGVQPAEWIVAPEDNHGVGLVLTAS